jgi:hypothetical protein
VGPSGRALAESEGAGVAGCFEQHAADGELLARLRGCKGSRELTTVRYVQQIIYATVRA